MDLEADWRDPRVGVQEWRRFGIKVTVTVPEVQGRQEIATVTNDSPARDARQRSCG